MHPQGFEGAQMRLDELGGTTNMLCLCCLVCPIPEVAPHTACREYLKVSRKVAMVEV